MDASLELRGITGPGFIVKVVSLVTLLLWSYWCGSSTSLLMISLQTFMNYFKRRKVGDCPPFLRMDESTTPIDNKIIFINPASGSNNFIIPRPEPEKCASFHFTYFSGSWQAKNTEHRFLTKPGWNHTPFRAGLAYILSNHVVWHVTLRHHTRLSLDGGSSSSFHKKCNLSGQRHYVIFCLSLHNRRRGYLLTILPDRRLVETSLIWMKLDCI